jgi:membrane associated rhomboid family serine protease
MKKIRTRFNRFCLRHRDKGIPNLMLYICLGSGLVYFMSAFAGNSTLYSILRFDRDLVLQGQVWRLFSYPLTHSGSSLFMTLISLVCYYALGRAVENQWGTLRFNLFYLSGVVLMDIFAMSLGGITVQSGNTIYIFSTLYADMGYYLNTSLLLAFATLYPDNHFLLLFIIPVKAWIFALLDLGLTLFEIYNLSYPLFCFPHNLFPLVAIANYLLFFGKDVKNVLPFLRNRGIRRAPRKKHKAGPTVVEFPGSSQRGSVPKEAYTHRCVVCGRTDTEHPDLEFRYCSRCKGYHCYCIDHINNHEHVE